MNTKFGGIGVAADPRSRRSTTGSKTSTCWPSSAASSHCGPACALPISCRPHRTRSLCIHAMRSAPYESWEYFDERHSSLTTLDFKCV